MYDGNYLAQHLRSASANQGNGVFAKRPDGSTVTYQTFFDGAEALAKTLISKGVQPDDRVAVQVDKSIEVLQLYVGTVLAGAVFLPLNTAYTATEVSYFIEDASPAVFVCRPSSHAELEPLATKLGVLAVETLADDGSGSLTDYARTVDTESFVAVPRVEGDLAAFLYTSGTTGRSKGAMLTHKNLWSNAQTLKDYWAFSSSDVLIHALPIFHTHGLFVAINTTLAAGSSLYFLPTFNADQIIDALPEATVLMGVPTFYVRLLAHPALSEAAVSNMRLFVSGSAPLLAETHVKWQEQTGTAILERYGMTETNMNTSNPYDGERRPGTVGYPLPGVEVKITDPNNGETLPVGTVGSIEVRGPNVFKGYWNMPEKTREELRDNGFFITGDLGMIDEQGYVSIIGRSKDLIITGGYNVYPKEIELLIDDLAGVVESAVIGLPHADFGEAVTAVVVTETGAELTEAVIKQALSADIAKFKQPKQVFFVDELPRNTMGKVQKNVLRETYSPHVA
uniref:Acetoacetyl-CoA synthetase [leucine] (EC) n=1 Tax=uncultured Thiotrichaceae bacterium TaxID=298394 RepID=A0A6S6U4N9_9GAMM|nr:MAG: Acetoacetyl-CoA synthetase [leucine] (EC [uncultured Thiotrichaceae bacterium]